MTEKSDNRGDSLGGDLDMRAADADQVKGGLLPIEPGESWTGFVRRVTRRKKKKAANRGAAPGGGRPV
jgi:hypothetical protein